ncbi:hypothetical protein AC1031_009653 [Aphanomyces cochlioides]|nr:hypothetical protein AC1031_009653 [Aphanomyces cochlioides]
MARIHVTPTCAMGVDSQHRGDFELTIFQLSFTSMNERDKIAHHLVHIRIVDDQADVTNQLSKWKMLYAPLASKHGYVPRVATESVSLVDSHTDEELARFHNTLQDVAKAQKNNPHAVFSPFNVFALLTQAEFSKMLQNSFVGRNISSGPPLAAESALTAGASIDWSTSTCSSSVKAQGDCGNCRAFSAVGTAEFAHCIPTGENLDLSEQQVTSCDTASSGCKGGYPSAAIDYQHNSGICLESAYPYTSDSTGQTGSCQSSCAKKTLSIGETVQTQGEASLVAALNKQPVSVIVESDNEVWRNYKSGVVTHCPGAQSDHAVIAVGYGTSTHDYFKVKNSWGAQWGDNGYIPELTGTTVAPPSPSTDEPTAHPTSSPTPKPSTTRSPITTTTVPTVEPTTTKSPKTKKPPKTKTPTPTTGSPETFAPTESPDTAAPSTSLPSPTAFPTSRSPSKKPVTTAATPAPGASGTGIQRQLITQTNKIRAAHGLGPVTWNAALAAEMQKFADSCPGFNHGGPEGWQNLAPFEPCSGDACLKIAGAAWMWYNDEETKWNYDAHTCNGEWADCGHFSNMMGPGVTQIACGWSQCSNGDSVWCNYESSEMNPVVPRIRGMTKQQLLASLTA